MEIRLISPANLNLSMIIAKTPFEKGQAMKKDYLTYIIHSIMVQRASKDDEYLKSIGKTDGFVPLQATILKEKVPTYKRHLDYLEETGIIECDQSYSVGQTSMGYRLCAKYVTPTFKKVPVDDIFLRRKINIGRQEANSAVKTGQYKYLSKWLFDGNLAIDQQASEKWIEGKLLDETENANTKKYGSDSRLKSTLLRITEKHRGFGILVDKIAGKELYFHVDENGHRLHTNLTNLPKGLRQFITYQGQNLVAVDIKNSQPYLCLPLLKKEFWENGSQTSRPTLKNVKMGSERGKGIRKGTQKRIIMFLDSPETLTSIDLQKNVFIQKVANGSIYEHLTSILERNGKVDSSLPAKEKRDKVKKMVLTLFFDDETKAYNQEDGSIYKLFAKEFPSIARIFSEIKKKEYSNLAILLQRIESHAVLDVVCKHISKDRPEIPVFTIHDSIVTTEGNEQYVEQVMKDKLKELIGETPTLSFEYWKEKEEDLQLKVA